MKKLFLFPVALPNHFFYVSIILLLPVFFLSSCEKAPLKGWLTYRNNNSLSPVTDEPIKMPLSPAWVHKPVHAPNTAWYEPSEEIPRSHFDNAHYVTSAGSSVFFASTVDGKVYALDASTGKEKWSFYTDGPVRCVPTIYDNRLYFGSDDGYVYCVQANNGKFIWKYRPGPNDNKILGNEHMISIWPVRTNVLVDNNIAYFAAGVFPYEGIYICAVDAEKGTEIWKNDTIGDCAHELDYNGISPQGYLAVSENILFVPSGRALPAAFDRKNGDFLFYIRPTGKKGGTWTQLSDGKLIAGVDFSGTPHKESYDIKTGKPLGDAYSFFPIIDMVVTPETPFIVTREGITALNRSKLNEVDEINAKLQQSTENVQEYWNSMSKEDQNKISEAVRAQTNEERQSGAPTGINTEYDELIAEYYHIRDESNNMKKTAGSEAFSKWKYNRENLQSIMLAGKTLLAGGEGFVIGIDAQSGKELWSSDVDGTAFGLAVENGNLYVSTDKGAIYCFNSEQANRYDTINPDVVLSPFPDNKTAGMYRSAADEILRQGKQNKGYCLVLDCGEGQLVYELARKTSMYIVGIDTKESNVRKTRELMDKAGLLGSQVIIAQWDLSNLPDYFANLIVSDSMIQSGSTQYPAADIHRVLKPCGGVICFGQPESKNGFDDIKMVASLKSVGLDSATTARNNGTWVTAVRGELEGAGSWTHVFADPQNTSCSDDVLVKGSLGVLWFGAPGPEGIIDRHASSTSPVSMDGRMFVEGEETIRAFDTYNGTFLWEREIPGAIRVQTKIDGGNLALTSEGLFVAAHHKCYRLDPATGETMMEYEIPQSGDYTQRRWGYIACIGKTLYGSAAMPLKAYYGSVWNSLIENGSWKNKEDVPEEYLSYYENYSSNYPEPNVDALRAFKRNGTLWAPMHTWPNGGEFFLNNAKSENTLIADMVFAIDTESGKTLWVHKGKEIANITISMGDGKLFLTDSAITEEQKKQALADKQSLIKKDIYKEGKDWDDHIQGNMGYTFDYEDYDVRHIIALDAISGEKLWDNVIDLTGCAGDAMASSYHKNVLMFFGNYGNHDAWRHSGDQLRFRRITALAGDTGDVIWSRSLNYRTRPLIVNDTIILEPHACDYRTGDLLMRTHPITGEQVPWEFLRPGHCCSVTSASPSMLFTRSFSSLMYDMENDRGVTLFGGIRASCFINMIPANGLLLFPAGDSGCTCSFPVKCSVAFKPRAKTPEEWAVFITHGDMTPVQHFAINLGAPADMKDDDGTVWFGYPNPVTRYMGNHYADYGVKFDLKEEICENMGYFAHEFREKQLSGTDKPWLYTSGCVGFTGCSIPLLDSEKDNPAEYTVKLGFIAQQGDRKGSRVFDIVIQGQAVIDNFDIVEAGSTPSKPVIKEFTGIKVTDNLILNLKSGEDNPTKNQAPIINFIEIVQESGKMASR